ncbi:MAG TPA: phytanoyl-CoA dioxygenase family protein, partial [Armatimonadota bacterium]|nr:phytanoyl-CoA dioxygenase family protein [Armatimonadota bacterium]
MDARAQFERNSFVIVSDAIPAAELDRLREAAARLTDRCRSGEHAWVRRAPDMSDTWGAGKMFQPTSLEPELIEAMCGSRIREVSHAILGANRLAVVSFLFNPSEQSWDGPWHRDSQYLLPQDPERQVAVVTAAAWSVQWNVALYEDDALWVVPGSGGRWNTPDEESIITGAERPMPGAVAVRLRPGEGVAYTPFMIHRGLYRPHPPRATLHFTFVRTPEPDPRIPDLRP